MVMPVKHQNSRNYLVSRKLPIHDFPLYLLEKRYHKIIQINIIKINSNINSGISVSRLIKTEIGTENQEHRTFNIQIFKKIRRFRITTDRCSRDKKGKIPEMKYELNLKSGNFQGFFK